MGENTRTSRQKQQGEFTAKGKGFLARNRTHDLPFSGRLLVLAQLSSYSVERVFSVLERIRRHTGDRSKEDMLDFRLLLQVNGDLGEMCNDLVVNYGRDA